MIIISYRGNLSGPNPLKENNPEYVMNAVLEGFGVMIDVWLVGNNQLFTGSLGPQYPINMDFLENTAILCRARTIQTLSVLKQNPKVHVFYNDNDDASVTTRGLVWAKHGSNVYPDCICSMPEWVIPDIERVLTMSCYAVCSSYCNRLKDAAGKLIQDKKPLSPIQEANEETVEETAGTTTETANEVSTETSDKTITL